LPVPQHAKDRAHPPEPATVVALVAVVVLAVGVVAYAALRYHRSAAAPLPSTTVVSPPPASPSAHNGAPTGTPTSRPAPPTTTAGPAASTTAPSGRPVAGQPLAGRVVGIDPGHNGANYTDPAFLNQAVWNGRENEACDTTGTETDAGYTEAQYNWNVAQYLQTDLEAEGATVVLTRDSNTGVGPCVTTRAEIINDAHAAVAIDIHADGGPAAGRGYSVLEPVADGPNDGVVAASDAFGAMVRDTFGQVTGMPVSTYDGVDGVAPRDDLAGLNLTTVPKVLIECGNMRNATDAALLASSSFQARAAGALAEAITRFLTSGG
jgi:N-acetylmuramoyl-L-alanine amidase